MILGITGTRHGMSPAQVRAFDRNVVPILSRVRQFHHGCCVGADYDAHRRVYQYAQDQREHVPPARCVRIHAHPPTVHLYQMPREDIARADVVHPDQPYHQRNMAIVDACDVLIVVPVEAEEQARGGTWWTYRYARSKGVPVLLLWP